MNKITKPKTERTQLKSEIKRYLIAGAVSFCLVAIMVLSMVLPNVLNKTKNLHFEIPTLDIPIEEKYALGTYNYSDLSNTAITLRADIMTVTKRNLPRPVPEILSDEFSLVYDTSKATPELRTVYGQLVSSSVNQKTATIKFIDYPSPNHTVSGTNAFTNGTTDGTLINSADFYKYMLMTQGQHLAMEAQQRSKDGSLTQSWLKKHPAADAQYGEVVGENNAVEKEIILDPIYRSFHATGLYMPAGEVVKVKVEGLGEGEKIAITVNLHNSLAWRGGVDNDVYAETVNGKNVNIQSVDAYFTKADVLTANGKFVSGGVTNQSQWARQNNRAPWIIADFVFDHNGEYNIGTPFGGVMHINPGNCYSNVKTTITGAVETPHYILGVTSPEYFETYLKDAPGVIAVLDTENGQLVSPTGTSGTSTYMRGVKKEEIDKLAMLWHSFFSVNESFTGGTYNRNNIVKFDKHVPAGAAVALGGYVYACPTDWFGGAMNYRGLLNSGTWGILHEIGHNHGGAYGSIWGFGAGREGEVRNNALTLLSYIKFCDVGTYVRNGGRAEHGEYADPFKVLTETLNYLNQSHSDFDDGTYGYFQCLGMYANIMHSFGADKFYELLYSYKDNPVYSYVDRLSSNATRADFNYRCATIYGMNFTRYFNTFYKANINTVVYTKEQLDFLNNLPNYEPISSKYAGGIDGVKTSGDYNIKFGEDVVFDLLANTISTLDTDGKKGFTILSVSNPKHGIITSMGDGRYAYTFNTNYTGALDEFSFKVRLSDGVIHELTIYLRISYNSNAKLTVYEAFNAYAGGINDDNWAKILENLGALDVTSNSTSNSYISNFGSGSKWQVRVLEYYWRAPKTGKVTFHFKQDDGLIFYFGNNFSSLEEKARYNKFSSSWTIEEEAVSIYVEEGQFYAIKLLNLNTGGTGGASIGYKFGNDNIANIPSDQIYYPTYSGKPHETFVYEPTFMVSKKDKIKLSTAGTDKNDWQIIEAPDGDLIQGGRIDKIERVELVKDAEGNPTGEVNRYYVEIDKWSYLIDSDVSTIMHTTYGDNSIKYPSENDPYSYVIDTGKVQQFNYFSVTTRTGALSVSKITKYELQISSDGVNYQTVVKGDKLEYDKNVAILKFSSVSGRYLKLLVKGSTGNAGQFVVIAELDAGITATTQRIVPATSGFLFTTKGWQNSSAIENEKSGYMMSNSKNQKLVFRFNGNSLAIYAAFGQGYGLADIKLDGKFIQTVNFNSTVYDARKLAYNFESLEDGVHTLEIITKSSEKVMINLFGISYTAELVNAPNIYLEKALTIALVVFIILFVLAFVLLMCLLFIPKFRKVMGNNKAINSLDKYLEAQKEKRKQKRAENKLAKQNEKASLEAKETKTIRHNEAKAEEKKAPSKTNAVVKHQTNKVEPAKKAEKPQAKSVKETKSNALMVQKTQNTKKPVQEKPAKPVSNSTAKVPAEKPAKPSTAKPQPTGTAKTAKPADTKKPIASKPITKPVAKPETKSAPKTSPKSATKTSDATKKPTTAKSAKTK